MRKIFLAFVTLGGLQIQLAAQTVNTAAGTTNRVLVNGGTSAQSGAITLSLPQDIHTGASPTFAGGTFNGNVSIGPAISPLYALQVEGAGTADPLSNANASITVRDTRPYNTGSVGGFIKFGGKYTSTGLSTEFAGIRGVKADTTNTGYDGQLEFFTRNNLDNNWTGDQKMVITANGNVGIGTTSPDQRLSVNGIIHSREVKVDLSGWPDYVFHKNYLLQPLSEIEQYIQTNQHLPKIPSAKEVTENGINLGEMNAKLLQKIEELTLYLIQQNKDIKNIRTDNEQLRTELNKLKSKQ